MPESAICEHCGKPVGADAPSGLCPSCLLRTAVEHGSARALMPLLPNLRYFGDYELIEEIARGGMGVVYRARQVSLDRIVAVKMMLPGLLATGDQIRRFQAEARTAAGMQHPNIVAIHEVGEFDGLHYFSMDYVDGPSLGELIRSKPLAVHEAAECVLVLAETVEYAHRKGILHRDLKPSNVLVEAGGRPRITDFGLARPLEDAAGLTAAGTLVGTPEYMPPEQASGEGAPLIPASDCYSLGAILYELLTGRPPYQGPTPVATVRMVLERAPVPPRIIQPNIPKDLEAICLRCLEKNPERRYQSAAGLAAALRSFLAGETLRPRPHFSPLRIWPYTTAALVVLLLIVWTASRNQMRPPVHAPQIVPSEAPREQRPAAAGPPLSPAASMKVAHVPKTKPAGSQTGAIEPSGGSGFRQVFIFRYPQPGPAAVTAQIEFHDPQSEQTCRVFLDPDAGHVALQADPLAGAGLRRSGSPGQYDPLENSVCAVDLSASVFDRSQESLKVRLAMQFKPAFAGPKEIAFWTEDAHTGLPMQPVSHGIWNVR